MLWFWLGVCASDGWCQWSQESFYRLAKGDSTRRSRSFQWRPDSRSDKQTLGRVISVSIDLFGWWRRWSRGTSIYPSSVVILIYLGVTFALVLKRKIRNLRDCVCSNFSTSRISCVTMEHCLDPFRTAEQSGCYFFYNFVDANRYIISSLHHYGFPHVFSIYHWISRKRFSDISNDIIELSLLLLPQSARRTMLYRLEIGHWAKCWLIGRMVPYRWRGSSKWNCLISFK